MLWHKAIGGGGFGGGGEPVGIDFDGTDDYLSRSSDLVGNADGKTFTFSAFFYVNDTFAGHIYKAGDFDLEIQLTPSYIIAKAYNGTSTQFNTDISAAGIAANTWNHLLISLDLANASNRSVYLNDVATTSSWGTYNNQNIDFTQTTHEIGNLFDGRLAHVFLDYTYRDLSVEANRRLFITADGKPAGGQASLSPILYLPMDDPEDPGRNDGTGGDFTLNGVVAQAGRGPNQYNAAASTFDGSADYVDISSVTGLSGGNSGTISFYFKHETTNQRPVCGFGNNVGGFGGTVQIDVNSPTGIQFMAYNTSNTLIADFRVDLSGTNLATNTWHHCVITFDLSNTSNRDIQINGVSQTVTWTAYTDGTINWASNPFHVARSGGSYFDGKLSDFWFDDSYTADLSGFYDTDTGKPKYLGASGELPTGSVPLIYLPLRADDAGSNKGTGGDFTVNSGPYTGARGPSEFWASSAEFNGSNQYLLRSGALTGASDGKVYSIALSVRADALSGNDNILSLKDAGSRDVLRLYFNTSSLILQGENASGTVIVEYSDAISGVAGTWINYLISIDQSSSALTRWYKDGSIRSPGLVTLTNENIGFSFADSNIVGAHENDVGGITEYFDGKIGFLWFNTEYIDFSQEANRLKFFDAFGYPVDLGEDGSLPTGNQPLIYMNNDFQLGTNLGSGGNFTPQNTPTDGGYVKG